MSTEAQMTHEEEAYERLLNETWEVLSEAAHSIFRRAEAEAYKLHLCPSYSYQPCEYEEAMEQMHLGAAKLTDCDSDLLAKIWRAALAAAASIDPDDRTPAWFRVYKGYLHGYYRTKSGMIEDILREQREAEFRRENAERPPEDLSDYPF